MQILSSVFQRHFTAYFGCIPFKSSATIKYNPGYLNANVFSIQSYVAIIYWMSFPLLTEWTTKYVSKPEWQWYCKYPLASRTLVLATLFYQLESDAFFIPFIIIFSIISYLMQLQYFLTSHRFIILKYINKCAFQQETIITNLICGESERWMK